MTPRLIALFLWIVICSTWCPALYAQSVLFGTCVLASGSGNPNGVRIGKVCDVYVDTTTGILYTKTTGTDTNTGWTTVGGGGSSSVSLTFSAPGIFSVTGSPWTGSGTIAMSLASQTANTVFAAPNGSNGTPTFRKAVFADIDVTGCAEGQIPKKSGSVLVCADDAGASAGASTAEPFAVWQASGTLSNEKVIAAGSGIAVDTSGSSVLISTTNAVSTGQQTYLISGGQIVWTSNYNYTVSAATYVIAGTQYTSAQDDVTLSAAHATLDRIDVIVATTTGAVQAVTGTPAAQPAEPDIDLSSQVKLGIVLVEAASSAPSTTNEVVYAENAGSPGEWDWTTSGTGFAVNSTADPRSGTTSIEGTNVNNGAYAQGERGSGTVDPTTLTALVLYIKSKATWTGTRSLQVSLRNAGIQVGTSLTIRSGFWGFDSSNTTDDQLVAIPISQFAVPTGNVFNQIRLTDAGGAIGFYIDDIALQSSGVAGGGQTGLTMEQADARYIQLPAGPDDEDFLTYDATTEKWVSTAIAVGGSSSAGTYASLPAAGNAGAMYFCTDCPYSLLRDDGAAWDHFLGLYGEITRPPTSGWTFDDPATGATATTTYGALDLFKPASNNLMAYYRTAPATPYTFTVGILTPTTWAGGGIAFYIGFREAATGKLITLDIDQDRNIMVNKWTSTSVWSSTPHSQAYHSLSPVLWLRGTNDGTNLSFQISSDGRNWISSGWSGETVTTFFTAAADQILVGAYNDNTKPNYIRVVHFSTP